MDKKAITEKLILAGARARIVDVELVSHPIFASIVDKLTTDDPAAINAAILEMQRVKPNLFKPWDADPKDFDTRERELREGNRTTRPAPEDLLETIKSIDTGRLNAEDFRVVEDAMRATARQDYSVIDRSELAAIAQRQKATA